MNRWWIAVAAACTLPLAGCDDGTGPGRDAGPEVDVVFDAEFSRTDTSVVVNGEPLLEFPSIYRSVRLYRYQYFGFGGFPELGYELADRRVDFWNLLLIHRTELQRNDSTIRSYDDHGTLSIAGVEFGKETTIPPVPIGERLAYQNFVEYSRESFARMIWVGGDTTIFADHDFHEDIVEGGPLQLVSTGSAGAHPASSTIRFAPLVTLTELVNGAVVPLDVDEAPVLDAGNDLVLEFDRALDPERAYIRITPYVAVPGARSAIVQPKRAARTVTLPASVMTELVEDSDEARVAYYIIVEEYVVRPESFTGTRPGGESFTLPLVQASEILLHVWIDR